MLKNRCFLLIFAILIAAALIGCGQSKTAVSAEVQPTEAPAAAPAEELPAEVPSAEPVEIPAAEPELDLQAKALSAYQAILEASPALEGDHEELYDASFNYEQNLDMFGNHYDQFVLMDLNQDDVPELIALTVVNSRWTPVSVYTYAEFGILISNPVDPFSEVTFEQNASASGAYNIYFCEEGHIHSVWKGDTPVGEVEENSAYALEGTTFVLKDCLAGENESTVYFSDVAKTNSAENRAGILQ